MTNAGMYTSSGAGSPSQSNSLSAKQPGRMALLVQQFAQVVHNLDVEVARTTAAAESLAGGGSAATAAVGDKPPTIALLGSLEDLIARAEGLHGVLAAANQRLHAALNG